MRVAYTYGVPGALNHRVKQRKTRYRYAESALVRKALGWSAN